MLTKESKEYLKAILHLQEAANMGIYKHLSDFQADRLLLIAREIKPGINFQVRECQDCINALVKFVFTAYDREAKKDMIKVSLSAHSKTVK